MTDKVVMKGVKMLYSSISFDQQDVQSLKRERKKQPVQGIKPAENINFQSRNINRMGIWWWVGWWLIPETKGQVVRKMVDLGGVFRPFGGLMGAPGVMAGGHGLLGRG